MKNRKLIVWGYLAVALVFACQAQASPTVSGAPAETYTVYLPAVSTADGTTPQALTCVRCFYVNSQNGSDSNPGTSPDRAWRTLAKVQATTLKPGDVIYLARGSSWTTGLTIRFSGSQGKPITFTPYGTGAAPRISNTATGHTRGINLRANWVVIDGLQVASVADVGVHIESGAAYNVIQNTEITDTGIGLLISGHHNLVKQNYIHDLHMVVNTPGGNDDYGAVGIDFSNGSDNEVAYNRIINCIASSYDFVTDGGAFEWWGTSDRNNVHHNWASGNNQFFEVGGGSANNTVVAYNVSINNAGFSTMHLTGQFGSVVQDFRIHNNTIVETAKTGWVIFAFVGTPTPATVSVRNNILYIRQFQKIANLASFTHDHNVYSLGTGVALGFTLGSAESLGDPQFVDLPGQNYTLRSTSPAVNTGVNLGYRLDFNNKPVPNGGAPDLGAFER